LSPSSAQYTTTSPNLPTQLHNSSPGTPYTTQRLCLAKESRLRITRLAETTISPQPEGMVCSRFSALHATKHRRVDAVPAAGATHWQTTRENRHGEVRAWHLLAMEPARCHISRGSPQTTKARGSGGGRDAGGPKSSVSQRYSVIESPDYAGAPLRGGMKGVCAGSEAHLCGCHGGGGAHSRHKFHDRRRSTRQAAAPACVRHPPRRSRARTAPGAALRARNLSTACQGAR
jgi:hypothetical protein